MPVGYHRGAEGVGLDHRIKAISLDHADHRVNEVFGRAVLANVNMNLVIPKKFIAQRFFKPTAEFLCQRNRTLFFFINPIAQTPRGLLLKGGPEINAAISSPPYRNCSHKAYRVMSRRIGSQDRKS